jgi:phosphoribosylformylglycinamidine (FGAM) synthase-like amidotransferase family enzyme
MDLEANGQVIFYYCDENGTITEKANPNGATRNIAGICNANRNVFGMMPHPERACSQVLGQYGWPGNPENTADGGATCMLMTSSYFVLRSPGRKLCKKQ